MNFSEKLTNLRKQKGLSQEELGEKLNVTRQTISKWELGQTSPDMAKLTEIANFFGVSVDDLTNEEKEIKEPTSNTNISSSNSLNGTNTGVKTGVIILVVILVLFLGIGIFFMVKFIAFGKGIFNRNKEIHNIIYNGSERIINNIEKEISEQEELEQQKENAKNIIEDTNYKEVYNDVKETINTTTQDLQVDAQELLNSAQEMQQDIMKNASQEQKDLLNDAQQRQQEMLQQLY